LQLFYCSKDDGSCEAWAPFSGSHIVRLLSGATEVVNHPLGLTPFPARTIERWNEFNDYPHPEEHGELGLVYDYDFAKKRVSVSSKDFGIALRDLDIDMDVAETIASPEAGDKLGGWPLWIQSVEYRTARSAAGEWNWSSRSTPRTTSRTCSATRVAVTSRSVQIIRACSHSDGRAPNWIPAAAVDRASVKIQHLINGR
jgi:hypothetical protein